MTGKSRCRVEDLTKKVFVYTRLLLPSAELSRSGHTERTIAETWTSKLCLNASLPHRTRIPSSPDLEFAQRHSKHV